ncbi:glycosyltransferase [Parasporobacterium paucivorans]|nr:glycosyltransferase [Parasporobacterium paucivorans]
MAKKNDGLFEQKYLPIIEQNKKIEHARPFLSVITRTQGKRPEALRETLLCLAGQTDTDFEILLIGHKLTENGLDLVNRIIEEQTDEIKAKIRFIKLDYGNRSTPLNIGFASAYGKYVSILDDDDLVFDDWVEEFHETSEEKQGTVLHSYIFSQKWMAVKHDNEPDALRAVEKPKADYCSEFMFINQLSINSCPTLGLAFPVVAFHEFGIIFDEELDTTEDWDFLMRTVFICGITDIKVATGIYRLWENLESSATLHDKEEWDKNREKVINKLASSPVALTEVWLKECMDLTMRNSGGMALSSSRLPQIIPKLYYSDGKGFNEGNSINEFNKDRSPSVNVEFEIPEEVVDIKKIRFDVCEETLFLFENINIFIEYGSEKIEKLNINNCTHNGKLFGGKILFSRPDPKIVFKNPINDKPIKITITGQISNNISEEMLEKVLKFSGNQFARKVFRRLKRIF